MGKRIGIMLPTMFTEKLFNKLPKPVYIQPKIEGDRLRVVAQVSSDPQLFSSGGKIKVCVPHVYRELREGGFSGMELDGELYRHGMRHSEIRSIVGRTKHLHPDYEKMEYHIFDLISEAPQHFRLTTLRSIFERRNFKYLKLVPSYSVDSFSILQDYYDQFLKQGYEGVVIRSAYAKYVRRKCITLLKLKPRVSEYFEIIGVEEERTLDGQLKGTFGSFILKTREGNIFNAGSGPTNYQRALMWRYRSVFPNAMVKIRFQGYTKIRSVPKLLSIDKNWLSNMETRLA